MEDSISAPISPSSSTISASSSATLSCSSTGTLDNNPDELDDYPIFHVAHEEEIIEFNESDAIFTPVIETEVETACEDVFQETTASAIRIAPRPSPPKREPPRAATPPPPPPITHFECYLCHKKYPVKDTLITHLITVHGQKKIFAKSANPPKTGFEKTTSDQPYSCKLCDRQFSRQENLRMHMRNHVEESKLDRRSTLRLEDAFRVTSTGPAAANAKKAVRVESKVLSCRDCNEKFTDRGEFMVHLKLHAEQVTLQCYNCDALFVKHSDLKAHAEVCLDKRIMLPNPHDTLGEDNKLTLKWVPGHNGVPGNEKADELARKGTATPYREVAGSFGVSDAYLKAMIKSSEQFRKKLAWDRLQSLISNQNFLLGIMTKGGHCRLRGHMKKMRLEEEALCRSSSTDLHSGKVPTPRNSVPQHSARKRKASDDGEECDDVPLPSRIKKKKRSDSEEGDGADMQLSPLSDSEDGHRPKSKASIHEKKIPKAKKKKEKNETSQSHRKKQGNKAKKCWTFLEHNGPVFAPPYERLPKNVKFLYDDKPFPLSAESEECATFYAKMLNTEFARKPVFKKNFFADWRDQMTHREKKTILEFRKCNFQHIHDYFENLSEERKAMSDEEKKKIKKKNEEIEKEYGFCYIDGRIEKIGNFRIEPPGLFRGRGDHPKMGKLKRRVMPEDVIINCSEDAEIPRAPTGHNWKGVVHDQTVTWLSRWTENVHGAVKYVMLNPSSKLKGESDKEKFDTARKLAKRIKKIRQTYEKEWSSKDMQIRQRATALYLIDRLALRAGNEKGEDKADTVGCCSLRYEHVTLWEMSKGKKNVVKFDFVGKDCIRYRNDVSVDKKVFDNLITFLKGKRKGGHLFDMLTTANLNKYLKELMDGLTAKTFRTFNASFTFQKELDKLTKKKDTVPQKVAAYNQANRAVAILCNHQRCVPKTHEISMKKLQDKIDAKSEEVQEAKAEVKAAGRDKAAKEKANKKLDRLTAQLTKLQGQQKDREANKNIALGTSKLNYLDPRISVAWCKKHKVPIDKVYNKTQRAKFQWAIAKTDSTFRFDAMS